MSITIWVICRKDLYAAWAISVSVSRITSRADAFRRADGLYRKSVRTDDRPADDGVDLYDLDWKPCEATGGLREPGHQFEWSWLLGEADRLLGGDHADMASRLHAFGQSFGIDCDRGVAVFALDAAGGVVDGSARLWAQTEWLRIALERDDAAAAARACAALTRFFDVPVRGLWRDRLTDQGMFVDEGAPASSLYHIVTGLRPLLADPTTAQGTMRC